MLSYGLTFTSTGSYSMPFQIRPLKEFLVRPALPPELSRISDLAYIILWGWDRTIRAVFRRLDPKLWESTGHNPSSPLSSGVCQEACAPRPAPGCDCLQLVIARAGLYSNQQI